MFEIVYYNNKVKKEILSFPVGIRMAYARILDIIIDNVPNIPMPKGRPMGKGLYAIRASGQEGIGRVFYCSAHGKKVVLLHSFVKKTQETPRRELDIAFKRLKEIKNARR
jgi:phage-related protein